MADHFGARLINFEISYKNCEIYLRNYEIRQRLNV